MFTKVLHVYTLCSHVQNKKKFQECNKEGPTQATAITADYDRALHALEHACRAAEDNLYQLSYEATHDKMKISSVFCTSSKLNGEQAPRGAPWVSGLVGYFVQTWPDSECSHTVQCLDCRLELTLQSLSPVLARYDPFGVDVPLNFNNTHSLLVFLWSGMS